MTLSVASIGLSPINRSRTAARTPDLVRWSSSSGPSQAVWAILWGDSVRGMKYLSIELSPQTLTREVVDQFNHLLADVSCPPLFVYDRDGVLQGALWYLHFRIVDLASDEEARIRAGRLGLRDNGSPEQREMWLAVQKFLSSP